METKLQAYIHDYNVRSDLFDILIADYIVRLIAEQSTPFIVSRNNQLENLPRALVEFKIAHLTQPLAVFQVDDFLFL